MIMGYNVVVREIDWY